MFRQVVKNLASRFVAHSRNSFVHLKAASINSKGSITGIKDVCAYSLAALGAMGSLYSVANLQEGGVDGNVDTIDVDGINFLNGLPDEMSHKRNVRGSDRDEDDGTTDESEDGTSFFVKPANLSKLKVFSGNANYPLAHEIAMHLGTQLGRASVRRFSDGEVSVNVHDSIRGSDVYVIQPTCPPVNENLMELIFMVSCMRRASADKITAIIPYFGYGRSDQAGKKTCTIAAADVAKMLETAGVDRVLTINLHNSQISGFFAPEIPVDDLDVSSVAIPYFQTKFLRDPVVVSPDAAGAGRAKRFQDQLQKHGFNCAMAVVVDHKSVPRHQFDDNFDPNLTKRVLTNEDQNDDEEIIGTRRKWKDAAVRRLDIVGEVKGKDCIIFDDLCDTANRVTRACAKLKELGARRVFAFITHGVFSEGAYDKIENSELIELVCVNTVPLDPNQYCSKIQQLSVGALVAETIRRIHKRKSVSALFQ